MVSQKRKQKLQQNIKLLFWKKAFLNLKIINIVAVLFYVHRGLSLKEVFYLGVVWAIVNLIAEIPSSLLADRWGRKKTLLLGVTSFLVYSCIMVFAFSFVWFVLGFIFFAFSFACFSGTDEALLYDTKRELGQEKDSLDALSKHSSALQIFKIITPLLGAFIAKDLAEGQFLILIAIDIVGGLIALFLVMRLTEAHHYMDVEELERGVMYDAVQLLKKDRELIKIILNKTLVFIASFILWRYHQELLVGLGAQIVVLGAAWSLLHLTIFIIKRNISNWFGHDIIHAINMLNILFISGIIAFVFAFAYIGEPYILMFIFLLIMLFETVRMPMFSELFNKRSSSFNRATTLSVVNFLKSIFDIPLLFISGWLVSTNLLSPYIFSLVLGLIVIMFFSISRVKKV